MLGEEGIQVRVETRVDGVEEYEQDLGLGHTDEGVAYGRRECEEGHGGPASKVD